ncbi:thioredoxin domain-containing protein [Candidatus Parcubacteria bacterium]|nr:thioredoxin domain-containing protein [Candidatus Parcubacteria bacterium]
MTTETKVIGGISILTILIIVGGIFMFNGKVNNNWADGDYSQYIETGLTLDATRIVRDYNPKITGPASASSTATSSKIAITEFLDYECPACATNGEVLTKQLLAQYGDRITITRKIFPVHGQGSIDSARLVLASQALGSDAYQKLHTKMFETQNEWAILGKPDRDAFFKKMIIDLGLDFDKLYAESQSKKYDEQIAQDKQDATALGIKATPSFIIGTSTRITGGLPMDAIAKYIDSN